MQQATPVLERFVQIVYEEAERGGTATRSLVVQRTSRQFATVGQVARRLQSAALIHDGSGRDLELTPAGRRLAVSVVRKHRLLECFLHTVVQLDWSLVHSEATRWQHVLSDHVEDKIDRLLGHPHRSPFGWPVPRPDGPTSIALDDRWSLKTAVSLEHSALDGHLVRIAAISEDLQAQPAQMRMLREAGIVPDAVVRGTLHIPTGTITVETNERRHAVPAEQARGVQVRVHRLVPPERGSRP